MTFFSAECHRTSLVRSQHQSRWWLGAMRQQTFAWANIDPDLCRHVASLRHSKSYLWINLLLLLLTHWGRNKIVAILQTFSNAFSWMKIWILIKISLKFVPKGPIDNIPALVKKLAWCWPGDKVIVWTSDDIINWCIYTSLSLNELKQVKVKRDLTMASGLFRRMSWGQL